MNNIASKALYSVLLAGGLSVLGAGAAQAIDLGLGGDDGLLSGTDILADLGVPITVGGNSISVIGNSSSGSSSTSTPASTPAPSSTAGSDSASGGTSVWVPVNSIIEIGLDGSGNGLLGINGPIILGSNGSGGWLLGPGQIGIADIGSGTDADATATVPVTVEGNSISVIGDSRSGSGMTSNGTSNGSVTGGGTGVLGDIGILGNVNLLGSGSQAGTDGTLSGILSGSQFGADAAVPVSVTCNSVSIVGSSDTTGCATAAASGPPTDPTDPGGESSTPGATGSGLAGTGAEITGALGLGALALLLGVIVTIAQRRFGLGG